MEKMDAEDSRSYGGSLPVPNVQELATNHLKDLPDRYIRPELKLDEVSIDVSLNIPVIDMAKLYVDGSDYAHEMERLHDACKHWGFFQLINHGVAEVISRMKEDTEEFFNLPLEEKKMHAQLPNDLEGYGQAFVVSEEQKLDWGDMLYLLPRPVSDRKMRFWPTTPTSFRSTMDKYSKDLHAVAMNLLRSMAKNLGVDPKKLTRDYEDDGIQGIRMNYYPPCLHADKVMGLSPHSDAVGLTLLVQVNEVQGLQIRKNNKWVPIKPIHGAIIVNIGDILEIMSNGEYRSIEHRAVINPQKERLSIATFHSPNKRSKIGPMSDLVKVNGQNFMEIDYPDYARMFISSKLDGKRLLDRLKIKKAEEH